MKQLSDLTVSRELAEELKKAGFPQDTYAFWVEDDDIEDGYLPTGDPAYRTETYIISDKEEIAEWKEMSPESICAAPTSSELRHFMAEEYDIIKTLLGYQGAHFKEDEILQVGLWTEQKDADAYARLYLYLKKHGLLESEN